MVYSESEIVHELEAGNEVCLNMLFDNYYRSLCVYAFRFVSDGDDVEDIVQEVFVSFWMNKKRTVFSGSIRSYLFGAVAKAASKFATRRGKIKFDDVEKYVDQFLEELGEYDENEFARLRDKVYARVEALPEKTKEIFEDTLTKMTKDSDTKTFPLMGNDYGSLIVILKDIDIQKIDFGKTFDTMRDLVLSNQKMVKNRQAGQGAKKTIRQTFLISIGLLILKKKENNLSERETENVQEYFKALKNIYQNSIVIELAEASLLYNTNSTFKFEDFENKIWLSSEQEFDLFKDFFDMIYVNHFKLEDNDIMVKCVDIIFKNLIYKVMSSERCVNISALNVCASLINAGIDIKNEIQILLTCLFKLYKETAIEQTDSEQETLHKLRCRILSCKIAKELYRRGIQAEILEDWKKISEDENEFVELRNINFDRE